MSISFRNDFAPDIRVINGTHPGTLPGTHPGTHPDPRPDSRNGDSLALATPVPSAIFAVQPDTRFTDSRPPENRTPDLRTGDLRQPELRTPELRTPELRSPELRTPELRTPELRTPELRSIDARLTELKNGAAPRDLSDVKMDQIRELLFGEVQRLSEQRITILEAKLQDMETALHHRFDAMQARIDALAAETRGEHRSTLDELARGIADLGDRVKRIPRE
jgi:hypothetical protein